jgi:hypothetical protein
MKNLKKFLSNSIVKVKLKDSINYILLQNLSVNLNTNKELKSFSLNKLKLKCLNLMSLINLKIFKFPLNLFILKNFDNINFFFKNQFNCIKLIKKNFFFWDCFSFSKLLFFSPQFYIIFFKNNLLKLLKLQLIFNELAKLKSSK